MQSSSSKNISSEIAIEEHFVTREQAKIDACAVFIEDNPEKALEKLLNLSINKSSLERLQYVNHLSDLLELIGKPAIQQLKQIIAFIDAATEVIQRAFLSQVPLIISVIQKQEDKGYPEIVHVILPMVSNLTNSESYDVKEEAGREMAKIAPLLTEDDRGKHLLTRVLAMAHDDDNEENRIIAVRLLSQMATLFGRELCEQFGALQLLSMGEDPQIRVRREVVKNLHYVGKIVSPSFFKQRLLPFYLRLCKESHWDVRRSCVDIIYEICNLCNGETAKYKEKELTTMMLGFLKDSNRWVKISAYLRLGEFISSLQGQKVHEGLVEHYLQMASSSVNGLTQENEIIIACAYNFPAVILTLGPEHWPAFLKLFHTLMKDNVKVKKPLVCSLHHIAKIIGEENAEKDLLPILYTVLKDKSDDIVYSMVDNVALFLKVFSPKRREDMVDIILNLQKDQKKWRIRESIGRQIDKLTLLFPPELIFRIIAPITFKLAKDPVACVREEASRKIYAILKALYRSEEPYKESVIENIKGFSLSNRFTNRQSFVAMCERIMSDPVIFKTHFLDCLLPLANDRVPNVRIAISKMIQKMFKDKIVKLCEEPQIVELVKKLKKDSSKDVRNPLQEIDIHPDPEPEPVVVQVEQPVIVNQENQEIQAENKPEPVVNQEEQPIGESQENKEVQPENVAAVESVQEKENIVEEVAQEVPVQPSEEVAVKVEEERVQEEAQVQVEEKQAEGNNEEKIEVNNEQSNVHIAEDKNHDNKEEVVAPKVSVEAEVAVTANQNEEVAQQ